MKITFFKNTSDNLHCTQAVLKSVLKYYFPAKNFSFPYLDKVTNHFKGKYTVDSSTLLFLSELGFEVVYIINYNYPEFAKRGDKYLKEAFTSEVYKIQKKYTDTKKEQVFAKKFLENKEIKFLKRGATLNDLKSYYKKNYTLLVSYNPYIIRKEKGYASHLVVITKLTKNYITFHDSGLPPEPNKKVALKLFIQAMQYPGRQSSKLIAIRKASYV